MVYKISFKTSVRKDLKRISKNDVAVIFSSIESELSSKANTYQILKGEFKGLRKYRIGEYRVIYFLTKDKVLILRIGHRKDVYK